MGPMQESSTERRTSGPYRTSRRARGDKASDLPGSSLTSMLLRTPVLVVQGRAAQRDIARLPGAAARDGVASTVPTSAHTEGAGAEHHLVVLGDSVAEGVGVGHHRDSIAGRLASRMSERFERPVAWHVIARSGADARDVALLAKTVKARDELARADAVVVSVGVNDVKNLRTQDAWGTSLRVLLNTVTDANPRAQVILLGVPPIHEFPSMPDQLGRTLGHRAQRLDAVAENVVDRYPTVRHYRLTDAGLLEKGKAFADDGFHPSAWLHRKLAKRLDALLAEPENAPSATPRP